MKRFEALDGLRGICAMFVVLFHIHVLSSFAEFSFFRNGRYFVEFFFILSGFVMFFTYGRRTFADGRLKDFLISRTFRIFPMHICMLIFFLVFEGVKLFCLRYGVRLNNEPFTGATAPSEIIPNLLLLQAWIPNAITESFNSVAWSISVEFYIYIIFAFILTAFGRFRDGVFVGIVMLSLTAMHWQWYFLKPVVLSGLSCFFLGCLAYQIYERSEKLVSGKSNVFFVVAESLLLLIIYFLLPSEIPAKRIFITLVFTTAVIVFAFEKGPVSGILKQPVINYLGKLSYSIYITHYGILTVILGGAMIAGKLLNRKFTPMVESAEGPVRYMATGNIFLDNILVISILLLVVYVSGLTYRFIELKGIEAGKRLKTSSKQAASPLKERTTSVSDKLINQHGKQTN